MHKMVSEIMLAAIGLIITPALSLAMEAVPVPEPSSALMLLSGIPAMAAGVRLMRALKR